MGALEKIMQLKQQGQTEPQIIDSLKQEGVSPKEINEALSQSKIKSALTENPPTASQALPSTAEIQQSQEQMQPSIMQSQAIQQPPQDMQQPMQEQSPTMPQTMQQPTIPMTEMQPQEQMQQPAQEPYPQEPYYQEPYQEYAPAESNIETINEVASQVVDEKTNQLKKQISLFNSFKEDTSLEIKKINERLSNMENTFNQLQIAIIGKIGEYGKNIQNISKEMHATQNSFSKILNPLTDNIKEMQKITGKQTPERPKPKTKKSAPKKQSSGFENYLR